MTELRPCIVIPAIKKNAVIPDQLVKSLAGETLIQRALDVARGVVPAQDVIVVTDSQEIALICERNGVRFHYNATLRFTSLDIIAEMRTILEEVGNDYGHIIVYRASCPLLTWVDINDAYQRFCAEDADCLITVKSVRHRIWEMHGGKLEGFLIGDEPDDKTHGESELVVESKALIILKAEALRGRKIRRTVPYFLNDRAVEINGYQDWWICERLLTRRHVVFVVAGYPAIGMGHVFRSLMLAHEIAHHKVSFLCTRASELAAASITARDYHTTLQASTETSALWSDVLALKPDLVINDMLDTDRTYMEHLKAAGIPVVNFEDEGSGSVLADLVINALYEDPGTLGILGGADDTTSKQQPLRHASRFLYGHKYFCLRDEFLQATQNVFRAVASCVLITFGGTDLPNFTRQTLDVIEPFCREQGIAIRIVTGPGYAHKEALERHVEGLQNPLVRFEYATNIMSRMMEGVDFAICSAGRTVYELAHMRIPGIVLAQHEREARHTFARSRNGFVYLGVMREFNSRRLDKVFKQLMTEPERRQRLHQRQSRIHFQKNKAQVVARILRLLEQASCFNPQLTPSVD
ncbi:MAG: cytidine 5'-phosphate N-acetylneuraminic acid synthetase [Bilophila sp.]